MKYPSLLPHEQCVEICVLRFYRLAAGVYGAQAFDDTLEFTLELRVIAFPAREVSRQARLDVFGVAALPVHH